MKNYSLLYTLLILFLVSCASPTPRAPVSRKSSSFLNESIERNKLINKQEEKAFATLMAKDSSSTYINSQYGFWYTYEKQVEAKSRLPERGDEIIYTYQISDIEGNILYTPEELGGEKNYLVDKQELIRGMQDGLKLIKEGEIVRFLFPSHKAYGYAGYKKIEGNQPLIYRVELKSIKFNNESQNE